MKKISSFAVCLLLLCIVSGFIANKPSKRILVFSKTRGYHHASIAAGLIAIQKLGTENGFAVDTTTDSSFFSKKTLKKYDAVVFLSTTGNVLNDEEQAAFEKYIQKGGGFVGVH